MEIILVDSPLQDKHTRPENIQLINGEVKYWFTYTSIYPVKEGGVRKFYQDRERFVKERNYKGIYLYDIYTTEREISISFNEKEIEEVYYIRWDYIK